MSTKKDTRKPGRSPKPRVTVSRTNCMARCYDAQRQHERRRIAVRSMCWLAFPVASTGKGT